MDKTDKPGGVEKEHIRILAAAMIFAGEMFVGINHAQIIDKLSEKFGNNLNWKLLDDYGFITDAGEFVVADRSDENRKSSSRLRTGMDINLAQGFADKYNLARSAKKARMDSGACRDEKDI